MGKKAWPYNLMNDISITEEAYKVIEIGKTFETRLFDIIDNDITPNFFIKEIIVNKYQHNKSVKAIANELGISTYKVRMVLAKTLRALRHPRIFYKLIKSNLPEENNNNV